MAKAKGEGEKEEALARPPAPASARSTGRSYVYRRCRACWKYRTRMATSMRSEPTKGVEDELDGGVHAVGPPQIPMMRYIG